MNKVVKGKKFNKTIAALTIATLLPFASNNASTVQAADHTHNYVSVNNYEYPSVVAKVVKSRDAKWKHTKVTTSVCTICGDKKESKKKENCSYSKDWKSYDDVYEIKSCKKCKAYIKYAHNYGPMKLKYVSKNNGKHELRWREQCQDCNHVFKVVQTKKCEYGYWKPSKNPNYRYQKECMKCKHLKYKK